MLARSLIATESRVRNVRPTSEHGNPKLTTTPNWLLLSSSRKEAFKDPLESPRDRRIHYGNNPSCRIATNSISSEPTNRYPT